MSAIHICVSEQINHNWLRTQPVQLESLSELKTHATYFNMFKVNSNHIFNILLYTTKVKGSSICFFEARHYSL